MLQLPFFLPRCAPLCVALLLSALASCATPDKAWTWPDPMVSVDQMEIVDSIRVKTQYTYLTREKERKYTVVLMLLVDAEGKVRQQKIEKASGNPYLDEATLVAARTARFKAYLIDGLPQPVTVVMPMHFNLKPPA